VTGAGDFTDDVKRDAVARVAERGCPATEASERHGLGTHSPAAWKRTYAKAFWKPGANQSAPGAGPRDRDDLSR